jgi:chromosome segregation protein
VTEGNAAPSDKFIELSYGFCEAYVEARSSEPTPLIETWLDECSALYRQWTAEPDSDEVPEPELAEATPRESAGADAEAADAPAAEDEITEPVALAVEDDGSPESLLRIAQEAVASGRGTEAKVYAMRAAAAFAQREAQQAQQRLSDIERRINEGGAHIEAARGELRGAEESVIEAEKKTRENEEALSSCGERTREGLEHLESIDTEIAELDERIRELQAQREAAAQRRAEADEELNRKRADESDAEATLDSQRAEEDNARNRLEEARQKVKNLERKRVELELEMERARDILSRQQSSLEDIEQTIAQLKNPEMGGAGESDELLF